MLLDKQMMVTIDFHNICFLTMEVCLPPPILFCAQQLKEAH